MADLDGAWTCTVSSPMGPQTMTITLRDEGGAVAGEASGPLGSIPIEDGRMDGDDFTFKMKLTAPMPMTLDGRVTVTGDTLEGKVSAGVFGSWPITGTKA